MVGIPKDACKLILLFHCITIWRCVDCASYAIEIPHLKIDTQLYEDTATCS